jgi:hypothetical protein
VRLTLLAWELMGILTTWPALTWLTLLGMNIQMLINVTLSEMNIEASKSAAEVLKSSTPKGNDGQQGRGDQSRMKEHARSTHL